MSALQLGLKQADRNSNDAISLVQTAEGALNESGGIVTRMRELAVQAANEGTMDTTERGYLQQEFNLLRSELDRIVNVTEYNGQKLVDGSISSTATASGFPSWYEQYRQRPDFVELGEYHLYWPEYRYRYAGDSE